MIDEEDNKLLPTWFNESGAFYINHEQNATLFGS